MLIVFAAVIFACATTTARFNVMVVLIVGTMTKTEIASEMKRVFHSLAELEAHSIDALNRYFDEEEFMTDKEQLEWMEGQTAKSFIGHRTTNTQSNTI